MLSLQTSKESFAIKKATFISAMQSTTISFKMLDDLFEACEINKNPAEREDKIKEFISAHITEFAESHVIDVVNSLRGTRLAEEEQKLRAENERLEDQRKLEEEQRKSQAREISNKLHAKLAVEVELYASIKEYFGSVTELQKDIKAIAKSLDSAANLDSNAVQKLNDFSKLINSIATEQKADILSQATGFDSSVLNKLKVLGNEFDKRWGHLNIGHIYNEFPYDDIKAIIAPALKTFNIALTKGAVELEKNLQKYIKKSFNESKNLEEFKGKIEGIFRESKGIDMSKIIDQTYNDLSIAQSLKEQRTAIGKLIDYIFESLGIRNEIQEKVETVVGKSIKEFAQSVDLDKLAQSNKEQEAPTHSK